MYMKICEHCKEREVSVTCSKPKYCPECIKNRVWNLSRSYQLMCTQCGKQFIGHAPNAKYCSDSCEAGGTKLCNCCGKEFNSKSRETKFCMICHVTKQYLVGTKHSQDRINRTLTTRAKWITSADGKKFYAELGKHNSENLKRHFSTEAGMYQLSKSAVKQSVAMKKRILDGSWTPNIHNRWTHWNAFIDIDGSKKKFRSSWEACVWFCNQAWEYEKIRVPNGDSSVITDFVNETTRTIYEIKPKSLYRKEKNKINAIIDWCQQNGYKFIWINEYNIMNYVDTDKFSGNVNSIQLETMKRGLPREKN